MYKATYKEAGLSKFPPFGTLRSGTEEVIYSRNYSLNKLGLIYLLFSTGTFSKSHILLGNKQLSTVGGHKVFKLSYFESFYMPAFESWLTFRGT